MSDNDRDTLRQRARERGRYPAPLNAGRSRNMQANRRTDTKPETRLRSALHRRGLRFRKDLLLRLGGGVRVRPDIVFTARKVAVFVDGCFWHVCPEHGRYPSTNDWYWSPKLRRNIERDRTVDGALRDAGWRVVRIWEHEDLDRAVLAVEGVVRFPIEHVFDVTAAGRQNLLDMAEVSELSTGVTSRGPGKLGTEQLR
ncbi:very short patch repair endonuclease [Pseudonocardia alaniniphila]|uniref:Very short patch repair endonuclease n=1 Tax=Pseudonocardia alaniniphila TaxID=75291 RepID=A0ABS9TUQ0_9PSEU|nr:very short patch repair endonuclease [Pseudonocardia alaniniphila]MCH6172284.1 very short patch repair endonuclease [Pseudonocardia alaniniphila]